MTTCLPLMKRVLTLLTKNVLIPLRLSANTLTVKRITRAGEGTIRAGQDF